MITHYKFYMLDIRIHVNGVESNRLQVRSGLIYNPHLVAIMFSTHSIK